MPKRMLMLTWDGPVMTSVFTDGAASSIGSHWNAIKHYLDTGDDSLLALFDGETINFHRFLTDLDRIDELAAVGELEFEDIYEDVG